MSYDNRDTAKIWLSLGRSHLVQTNQFLLSYSILVASRLMLALHCSCSVPALFLLWITHSPCHLQLQLQLQLNSTIHLHLYLYLSFCPTSITLCTISSYTNTKHMHTTLTRANASAISTSKNDGEKQQPSKHHQATWLHVGIRIVSMLYICTFCAVFFVLLVFFVCCFPSRQHLLHVSTMKKLDNKHTLPIFRHVGVGST